MSNPRKHFWEFDQFRADATERVLWRADEPVALTQKAFDVLLVLIEGQGHIVTKDELMEKVWPDTFVEESNLSQNIYTLRKTLGETAEGEGYIQTVPRRGYRFARPVNEVKEEAMTAPPIEIVQPVTTVSAEALPVAAEVPLPTVPTSRRGVFVGLGAAALVALVALGWLYAQRRARVTTPNELTLTALTTTGNIMATAIAPDGKYVAYATNDNDRLSTLWLEELVTATRRAIIPPAETRYYALTFTPDGTQLYYSAANQETARRSLFRVSLLGGPSKKLTDEVNLAVSFAPDGKQMALRRALNARRVCVLTLSDIEAAQERELVTVRYPELLYDPAWSPDGQMIAAAAGNPNESAGMYVIATRAADGASKTLTAQRWKWIGQVAWLDANALLMVAQPTDGELKQLWRLDLRDGTAQRMSNDTNTWNRLSYSATTRTIAAMQVEQLSHVYLLPVNEPKREQKISFGAGGFRGDISWLPDGRLIYDGKARNSAVISVMNQDGSNAHSLTNALTQGAWVGATTTSKDGRYVVFASDLGGGRHLWRMQADGSELIQLTYGQGEDHPAISPDNEWVYFTLREHVGTDRPTIGRVPFKGGDVQPVTTDFTAYPALSPDGKYLACLHAIEPGLHPWHLALYPLTGGQPTKIFTHAIATGHTPQWSPDGQTLAYSENPTSAPSKLWLQSINESQSRVLAEFTGERIFGLGWSHDGKQLVLVRGLWATNIVLAR